MKCSCGHRSRMHIWSLRYLAYVCVLCTCIHDDSRDEPEVAS